MASRRIATTLARSTARSVRACQSRSSCSAPCSSRAYHQTSSLHAEAGAPAAATSPASKAASPPPASTGGNSTSALSPASAKAPVAAAASAAPGGPSMSALVDQIEKLTLLEAADLVQALKTRLNIQEVALPSAGAAAAAPAAAPAPAAEEEQKPKEKTILTVKLTGLKDPTAKAKVIREVKALNSSMNLVEAKKFVESAPQVLKEGLNKEDSEKLKKAIEAAGGVVELE